MNTNFKTHILISTLATSLLVLAGCATQPVTDTNVNTTVNTNTVTNTNKVNGNTNTNTNSEQISEVETSDWLTYENDEYGFSFKYPKDLPVKFVSKESTIEMQLDTNYGYTPIMKLRVVVNTDNQNLDEWLKKNVDVNDRLIFTKTMTTSGLETIGLSGADSIEDFGSYPGWGSYFTDPASKYFFAVAYPQDRGFEKDFDYDFDVVHKIVDTITFNS